MKMDTKKKILYAAAEEFAIKGYSGTTIRDICIRAGVNLAAVNYHFRSKEELYNNMFEFLFTETQRENVLDRRWNGDFKEWKKSIKAWVVMSLDDIVNPNTLNRCKFQIFCREMMDSSEIFPNIYEMYLSPILKNLETHFRKVMPKDTGEEEIYIRIFSVMSDCFFYFQNRVIVEKIFPDKQFARSNIKAIAELITEKACLGIERKK